MISRRITSQLNELLRHSSAVVLLGPRQAGKTTLALEIAAEKPSIYLDLEDENDRAKLANSSKYLTDHESELVILDEVHRVPELFQQLRGIIDRGRRHGRANVRFLLLGSAAMDLLEQSCESLAGRISYVRRQKTDRRDAGHILRLLMGGRFPRLWAPSAEQRDLRQLLVEATQSVTRLDEGFRKQYAARCHHKPKGVAKVAAARKLAVRFYWMLRQNVGYPEIALIESSSGVPLTGMSGVTGEPLRDSPVIASQVVTLNEHSRIRQ